MTLLGLYQDVFVLTQALYSVVCISIILFLICNIATIPSVMTSNSRSNEL